MLSKKAALVFIPRRFCGPPESGNGGYSAGLVANTLSGVAECTLRKPIPIERELIIEGRNSGAVLLDQEQVVIECKPAPVDIKIHPPVTLAEAEAAAARCPGLHDHPFPTCFVCGPQRSRGDGMRIFPGRVQNHDELWAAPWIPDPSLANGKGEIKPEFIWAAMDCPTGFAGGFPWAGKLVTGRLAVRQLLPVKAGEPHILMSWHLGWEGRKSHSAATLYGPQGELCAQAKATWIKLA